MIALRLLSSAVLAAIRVAMDRVQRLPEVSPRPGAVLAEPPMAIAIAYPRLVDATRSQIQVIDPDGVDVASGALGITLERRRPPLWRLRVACRATTPGRYTIRWVITEVGGVVIGGSSAFSLAAAPVPAEPRLS
ncbi:MAG: copper resistance protein CopC [Dehalococcoidia bacterium]|nr:copper resistance protein CopC [Dehalococcoidia bacterium]